jgi:hypothetical protein
MRWSGVGQEEGRAELDTAVARYLAIERGNCR